MPLLPRRRSVDPLTILSLGDRGHTRKPSDLPQTPRTRARSEASILRRVSTLFSVRRRTSSKISHGKPKASPAGIEHRCSRSWSALPRVSSGSTPQSSLEIRRPSGLGRRASLIESDDFTADSDSFEKAIQEEADTAPSGFASLPNLSSGAFHSPDGVTCPPLVLPRTRRASSFVLPDSIFRVVLEFLTRNDLTVVALVSSGFCFAARYALYHSLDVQAVAESSLQSLYSVLARRKELATLVVSFYCHSLPSPELASTDSLVPSVPLDNARQALRNMYNLKSLTLASFASIRPYTSSFAFSLMHLTVLDQKITQPQLVAMRDWLASQPSLEFLSFPRLIECISTDPSFVDEWTLVADPFQTEDHGPFSTILPGLKSLRASTEIISTLCAAMHNPIEHLTLDVHETLYTGLRPSTVIRALGGVRDMHVIFAPEVDKRTVEKFLGITGSILTGEDKAEAMKSLEVEVSWTDEDAAETLYDIVTSIISRFRGLETLKLTSPFRSIQAPIPGSVNLPLPRPLSPPSRPRATSSFLPLSKYAATLRGGWVRKEFVACSIEKNYAKTWTKRCPSLSDIQFDYSCSMTDSDVELCGMWFRRKIPLSLSTT